MKKIFTPFLLFALYLTNRIVNYLPFQLLRKMWYLCLGTKLGKGCHIDMGQYILAPYRFKIGNHSHINQDCIIDARSGITIGDNVSISHRVALMTGSHDINSEDFKYKGQPIVIGDYAFIGVNATVLQGVKVGKGAVVCAGAVVTKDVPDYAIVAGVSAKIIGYRSKDLNYKCEPESWFL